MKHLLVVICLLLNIVADAQQAKEVFRYVDKMPVAAYDIDKYITENMHYPEIAYKNHIEGAVTVRFIVTETGAIDSARIVGKRVGAGLEEEAVRIISSMPPWKPAILNETPVRAYYTKRVIFRINDK